MSGRPPWGGNVGDHSSSGAGRRPARDRAARSVSALAAALERRALHDEVEVPPYPAVALRVQELLGRNGCGLHEVARVIGADAALAAGILRCANAAIFRRGAPVLDLTQALARIGVQQATRLLLASGLAVHAQAAGPLVSLRRLAWIEGLASAAACQALARLRGLKAEDAFTLGLLHDFGRIVALALLERILESEPDTEMPQAAWEGLVEQHHQVLGQLLARRWHLPPLVGEVIAAHATGDRPCSDPALLEVVQVVDRVVALLMTSPGLGEAELAAVPGLRPAERGPLALVLERVPEFVAAFETPAAAAAAATAPVQPPAAQAKALRRAVRLEVSVKVASRARRFTAVEVGPEGLVLIGDEPLPENRLLEADLQVKGHLSCWVLSRLCQRQVDGYRVEVQPFALDSAAREAWDRLVLGDEGGEAEAV